MPERCTRFLIDSNLFIAAVKSGWTKSSELLSTLLDGSTELVANKALLAEYEKYAQQLEAEYIFFYLKSRIILIDVSEEKSTRVQAILSRKPVFGCSSCCDLPSEQSSLNNK